MGYYTAIIHNGDEPDDEFECSGSLNAVAKQISKYAEHRWWEIMCDRTDEIVMSKDSYDNDD